MYPRTWAQDVLRCHLCKTPGPIMYCDICHMHLCVACVDEHLLDYPKEHKVVTFKKCIFTLEWSKHRKKLCEVYCELCDIPTCVQCASSGEHMGHQQVDILKSLETKKEVLRNDLQELEKLIFPKYQKIASAITDQKADLIKNSKILTDSIKKHGEDFHREIDIALQKMKFHVNEMELNHLVVLNKQENEIKRSIFNIEQSIADLRKLLNSNNISLVSAYKSRNVEFRSLPPKLIVSLPRFSPMKINEEQIYQQIGSLSALSMETEEQGYTMRSPAAEASPLKRPHIDVPLIIIDINTECGEPNRLRCVSCLSDDEVWTSGQDNMLGLYSLLGKLVKSIQTKSREIPGDIAVNKNGELVYTDPNDRTVNIVQNTQIQTVIKLQLLRPFFIGISSSGDLMIVMSSDDKKQTKLVCYNGSKEKQMIQYDDKGISLFSSGRYPKYISENKNLDVCVADRKARAVVAVNQAGKLRFTYTGSFTTTKRESFDPVGISTDSQSRILTADGNNDLIHILDQDGQFLRYIDNCNLEHPTDLCVDTRDNLYVGEWKTGKVKKIQYYI